ncbi:MAG: hypothetical protein EU533_07510 [Promethearchaeota archaeon]|nr:MAG: hypothetical protein EU533_07510 [Candidatus Lokiarchaeota archaeon]
MYLAIDLWCWVLGIWITPHLAWYLSSLTRGPIRVGVYILFFLGVIIHEFSHLIASLICGVPVEGIEIKWKSGDETAPQEIAPHGSITPGDFRRSSFMQGLMISFSPLFVSTFLLLGCIDIITLIDVHCVIKTFTLFFAISLILTAAPSLQDLNMLIWAISNDILLSLFQFTCYAISLFFSIIFLNFSLLSLPFEFMYYILYFVGSIMLYFIIFYSSKWMGRGIRAIYRILLYRDGFLSNRYRTRRRINSKKAPKEKKSEWW